jgi:hypothetical protein
VREGKHAVSTAAANTENLMITIGRTKNCSGAKKRKNEEFWHERREENY